MILLLEAVSGEHAAVGRPCCLYSHGEQPCVAVSWLQGWGLCRGSSPERSPELRHPGRLLEVLRRQPGGPAAALGGLPGVVGQLQQQELATALSYCR